MLDYTVELIGLAASNSLAVFCLCNLIIALLLIGSSKSDEIKVLDNAAPDVDDLEKIRVSSANNCIEEEEEASSSSVSIDMVDESNEEEDDEFRSRVEDFIEKINRGWRAEKIKT